MVSQYYCLSCPIKKSYNLLLISKIMISNTRFCKSKNTYFRFQSIIIWIWSITEPIINNLFSNFYLPVQHEKICIVAFSVMVTVSFQNLSATKIILFSWKWFYAVIDTFSFITVFFVLFYSPSSSKLLNQPRRTCKSHGKFSRSGCRLFAFKLSFSRATYRCSFWQTTTWLF